MSCYFSLFYCLLDLSCGECDVISLYYLYCSVNGSVCLVCCVFDSVVNCLVKQLCLGVVVILLLNVMEVFSVGGGVLLDRPCMVFQRMCVLCLLFQCASKCYFYRFCSCFCMSEVISSFKGLSRITGVCSSYVVSLCDFAYYMVG